MAPTTRNLASQLATIAAKLDAILASLRDGVEEIKVQLIRDGCNKGESEGDSKNMVAEEPQGSNHDPFQQLGSGIDNDNKISGVGGITAEITDRNDLIDDGIGGTYEIDKFDGTGIEDWGPGWCCCSVVYEELVQSINKGCKFHYHDCILVVFFLIVWDLGKETFGGPVRRKPTEGEKVSGPIARSSSKIPATPTVLSVTKSWEINMHQHSVLAYIWVHEAGQPTIEWLIAWHNVFLPFDLRTSRFSGPEIGGRKGRIREIQIVVGRLHQLLWLKHLVTGELIELSEQAIIDCSTTGFKDTRDDGLNTRHTFKYLVKNRGIPLERDYPFKGQIGKCNKKKKNLIAASIKGYAKVPANEHALKIAVANQPICVSLATDEYFDGYTGCYCGSPNFIKIQRDDGDMQMWFPNYDSHLVDFYKPWTKVSLLLTQGMWFCGMG
ncbi:hypothetical protein L1987_53593 [Smallanthus sonchifolius]|uniref:Uncharacterized protein n=1 Tax=Smallanthus sonchifolius TaxID=185202 RepID=A0ACB9EX33_9ASTR|nr:hypothetical protein L1987_53593 [Smallanthus sonchifolius]